MTIEYINAKYKFSEFWILKPTIQNVVRINKKDTIDKIVLE
ncbi:hypothetical protein ACVWYF_003326 [Hymenobacter sp. UYAg731]